MTIDDPAFNRVVTLREAYLVAERFVTDHLARGEVPIGIFLAYFSLAPDGRPGDPAALDDYLAAVAEVLPAPAAGPGDASRPVGRAAPAV